MENIRITSGMKFGFHKPRDNKLFEGVYEQDKFKIQRLVSGRNSFLPQIKGQIRSNGSGTKLIADLKVKMAVLVFMFFWLGFVFIAFLFTIVGIYEQGTNIFFVMVPVVMIAFGIGLPHVGFNMEEEKSIYDLKRILKRKIKELQ